MTTRRHLIAGLGTLALSGFARPAWGSTGDALDRIAQSTGGRLAVFALDTGTGRRLSLNADARCAMCSTVKLPLAAAVLARVDRGKLDLAREIRFGKGDLLDYAPVVREHLATGSLSIERLCRAMVELSDNSAANLLFPQVGGPAGLTRYLRQIGDGVSRSDRTEPGLNLVRNGEVRDTTTPTAMAMTLRTLIAGDALTPASRTRLMTWMETASTGRERLRGGLPADWRCGDKTGTSGEGWSNDIAFAIPPGRKPILVACYLDAPDLESASASAAHAQVGSLIGRLFA